MNCGVMADIDAFPSDDNEDDVKSWAGSPCFTSGNYQLLVY